MSPVMNKNVKSSLLDLLIFQYFNLTKTLFREYKESGLLLLQTIRLSLKPFTERDCH